MIRLQRGPRPITLEVFTKKSVKGPDGTKITKAERELQEAIAFFTDPANFANEEKLTKETFSFSVYRDTGLVEALGAVFGRKCAYCESDFAHVTPREIEHFRPKSEIAGDDKAILRPGYYWLAGEWENLLVSCVDCNRARNHEVPGQPKKVKLGKAAQFPLADEQHRIRKRAPLGQEETVRLLLDPCNDDPDLHLTFDEKGLIHPRAGSARGKVSITVYALQRKALVEKRLEVLNLFRHHFDQLDYHVRNHNRLKERGAAQDEVGDNLNQIRAVKEAMKTMLAARAPYQAMLKEWIRTAKARGDCDLLEQFGIDLLKLLGA